MRAAALFRRAQHRRPRDPSLQLDLFFDDDPTLEASTVIPIATARPKPGTALGWHGITPKRILERCDHRLIAELGGEATKVIIAPGSPARRAGLKSGDFVVSVSPSPIEDMPLNMFAACGLPSGSEVFVKFWRPQRGPREICTTVLRLRKQPGPPKPRPWKRWPQVGLGPEVTREERKLFMAEMSAHPRMPSLGKSILARLVLHYDGPNGAYPSYATLARDMRCKRRQTIMEHVNRLAWLGVVEVVKGIGKKTTGGRTNMFIIHWPEGWGGTVVNLKREGGARSRTT
jgi:hypothetical protein